MKASIKAALSEKKLPINRPNRKQGKTHNLCTCSATKREHFNNALGHGFKAGDKKNLVEQSGHVYVAE